MKRLLYISLLFASCSVLGARSTEEFPHWRIGVQDSEVRIYTYDHSRAIVLEEEESRHIVGRVAELDSVSANMYLDGVLDMAAYSGLRWWESAGSQFSEDNPTKRLGL